MALGLMGYDKGKWWANAQAIPPLRFSGTIGTMVQWYANYLDALKEGLTHQQKRTFKKQVLA